MPDLHEDILDHQVCGFHRYALNAPVHLIYVSQNLCDMLGVDKSVLLHDTEDRYAGMVHPNDLDRYMQFLRRITAGGRPQAEEYRLLRADGSSFWVRDTITAEENPYKGLLASSVLTDITDLKRETDNLYFLNDTIPCGFLKYTCEKQPKITYINQNMQKILRIPDASAGEADFAQLYKSDIFLLIPMEEHRRFSLYLKRVYAAGTPVAGEMTLLRCDGTRVQVFGWVIKHTCGNGTEEFQSVCMDISERHRIRSSREMRRYLNALTDVYDRIFEFNLAAKTLTCLHCEQDSLFRPVLRIPMQIDCAIEQWLQSSVAANDQQMLNAFLHNFCLKTAYVPDSRPPQITYCAKSADGSWDSYTGTFLKIDSATSYYCCRRAAKQDAQAALLSENTQLKENMKTLVTHFMDGFAAFEISAAGLVKPLYISENVHEFFGYTDAEWLELMKKYTPIDSFLVNSESGLESFHTLLQTGEAEFVYFDYRSEKKRRVKAVCSPQQPGSRCPRYVMLYAMDSGMCKTASGAARQSVQIRTFGYFDVFIGDKPVPFRNKKAKELLALLVDRRGGYVTSEEAISFLWEDEPVNSVTLARYRKAALRLKNTLEEYGISNIIESVDGKRRIIPENVQCDLYLYLTGETQYSRLFNGSYLANYSWSETTLGELTHHLEQEGL